MLSILMKVFVAPIPLWGAALICAAGWGIAQFGVMRKPDRLLMMDRLNCLLLGFSLMIFPFAMPIAVLAICLFLLRLFVMISCERECKAYAKRKHTGSGSGQNAISAAVPGHGEYSGYGGGGFGGGAF